MLRALTKFGARIYSIPAAMIMISGDALEARS